MPELPEVEFAARALRRWMRGRRIVEAEAPPTRIFRGSEREDFVRLLPGTELEWIERRGKYLLFGFTKGVGLISHLGMTGKWVRVPEGQAPPSHVRARLELDSGEAVVYRDPRLFGRIAVHPVDELFSLPEIRALGPDPLIDGLDAERLHRRLSRSARPVKVALMDQSVLAGIGNIQATEALFLARIHPARPASSLEPAEVRKLAEAIVGSIHHTLEIQGEGDAITYVEEARSQNPFRIYGRAGSPCPRCRTPLEKVELGGRTSVFCPRCQPLRPDGS